MIHWLGRRDPEEILIAGVVALWLVGGVLLMLRSRRAGPALLLASIVVWACPWLVMIGNDAHGHDCIGPHHEGELPALLVTLGWGVVVAVLLARRRSLLVRLLLVAGTAALFVCSLAYMLSAQPPC